MQRHILLGALEQLGNFNLAKPDGFCLYPKVEAGLAVIRGIKNQLTNTLPSLVFIGLVVILLSSSKVFYGTPSTSPAHCFVRRLP
jgi:hypothetical protein